MLAIRVLATTQIRLSTQCIGSLPVTRKFSSTTNQFATLINSKPCNVQLQIVRSTGFFAKVTAEELWKGVTSVSNAGKKRGRGKGVGKKVAKDLNRGQVIGVGKINMVWPGLNSPIVRGKELVHQQELPEDPQRTAKLIELRDKMGVFKRLRLAPTERGWTGNKMPGRSIGPPDPVGEDNFEGFDTRVLEMKTVVCMKGNFGRYRRQSVLAVTGNGKGLAGFALSKSVDSRGALRKAKNRAGQQLMCFDLFNGHTIHHDFFSQFGKTKIFAKKRPEGYGLRCHRAINTICQVVGIKDLYAKVEGPTNLGHIVKAFFLGLLQQKTHEQLAEEKQMHLVEFRKDTGNFPAVMASPTVCRQNDDVPSDEIRDLSQHALGGRVILKKKKFAPFYTRLPNWPLCLQKQENVRNHDKVRLELRAEYGEIRSFLTEKYPECKPHQFKKQKNVEEETA